MDTSALDFDTLILLVTLLVAIMGSTLTILTLMYRQFNHLDNKFDTKIDALDNKFDTKIDALDTRVAGLETNIAALDTKFDGLESRFGKLDAKFDAMGRDVSDARERLARIEGHLMAPEGFRMRGTRPSASGEAPPEDPDLGHREAG